MEKYTIGVDFGTASVRSVVVRVSDGNEISSAVYQYKEGIEGCEGCISDTRDPLVARQHPVDYIRGIEETVRTALIKASEVSPGISQNVIAMGVDTTGTTLLPVLKDGTPLVDLDEFRNNLSAHIWLWKDHSALEEAEYITQTGQELYPEYLEMVGGRYSSEWFWSKVLHCLNTDKRVYDAAFTWVEVSDWLVAKLCGLTDMSSIPRGICAAGHKALYNTAWGGYPDKKFIESLNPELLRLLETLNGSEVKDSGQSAGLLSSEWASKTGLPSGIPLSMPAFDAHFGGIGGGVKPGTLVKTIGTSTCDLTVTSGSENIKGMAGIVKDSIIPGFFGIEAGQSGVGDIFNWFEKYIAPSGRKQSELMLEAEQLKPGESGLLSLDWHNGNRTVLIDQRLTGLILGLTLHSTAAEIYRALIEATAFGARVIQERMVENGVAVSKIIVCGGVPRKSPLLMQIYSDVFNSDIYISKNEETCALGGAIAAAVVAGAYPDFVSAIEKMTDVSAMVYKPIERNVEVYNKLYRLYLMLHDSFGISGQQQDLSGVMKELIDIRNSIRSI